MTPATQVRLLASPPGNIVLSSNRLGRHPFTVKTYGFESRRHDRLGHSAAASTPDFDSGGPGSSPGALTKWSFGRRGVCVGLKIRRTWFNSARLRRHGENSSVGQSIGLWIQRSRVRAPLLTPREYSSVVEQMAVNHRVVGSSPSIPANRSMVQRQHGGLQNRKREFESFYSCNARVAKW